MLTPYTLIQDWTDSVNWQSSVGKNYLPPHHLLLLTSDGSLTRHLETIRLCRIAVEIKSISRTNINDLNSTFLETAQNQEVLERDVWLKDKERRLVYAHSVIPVSCMNKRLLDETSRMAKPLGRILSAEFPFFRKDKIEVGIVSYPHIAAELSISKDTPLWARRYRLSALNPTGSNLVQVMVLEIFSPDFLGMPAVNK